MTVELQVKSLREAAAEKQVYWDITYRPGILKYDPGPPSQASAIFACCKDVLLTTVQEC